MQCMFLPVDAELDRNFAGAINLYRLTGGLHYFRPKNRYCCRRDSGNFQEVAAGNTGTVIDSIFGIFIHWIAILHSLSPDTATNQAGKAQIKDEIGSVSGFSILSLTLRSKKSIQLRTEFWSNGGWVFQTGSKNKWP